MTPADPKSLAALLREATNSPADRARVARSLAPSPAQIAHAVVDPAKAQELQQVYARWFPPEDAPDRAWLKVLDVPPNRTQIQVFGATGAEIGLAVPGTVAAREFPGGAQGVAAWLNPELTFFEATFTEPGVSSGTRLHLFCHAEGRWCMLGPLWRALRG